MSVPHASTPDASERSASRFEVDHHDRIRSVDEGFVRFAHDNGATETDHEGGLRLTSTMLREEPCAELKLLDPHIPRSDDAVRMCGWCKRTYVDGEWARSST